MGEPRREVLLHIRPRGYGELLTVSHVVVADYLDKRVFLHSRPAIVVDARVEQSRALQLRRTLLHPSVVADGLGDGARCQDGVELVAVAQHRELIDDVVYHLELMRRLRGVLGRAQEILDALHPLPRLIDHRPHRRYVHVVVENLLLLGIAHDIVDGDGPRALQGNSLAELLVLVRCHHVRVEAEHVSVAYAVRDAVPMQAVAEDHGRGGALLLVLLLYGRAGEAEVQGVGEAPADVLKHGAEGRAVALIKDEYDALLGHTVKLGLSDAALARLHVAHLLDGGNDESVLGVVAFHQLVPQDVSVLGGLHVVIVVREGAVLLK